MIISWNAWKSSCKVLRNECTLIKILCVILLLLLACPAFSYTYRGAKRSQPANDSEYEALIEKFPKYRYVINKLYSNYSGWVLAISERYGMLPLLAICGRDEVESVFPILWRYAETFREISEALGSLPLSEKELAGTALDILIAFTVIDSDDKANYYSEVKTASLRDSRQNFTGRKANYYARKISESPKIPANFLHELKAENSELYSKFLHEISQADYDTLKAICDYPNGLTFLLNTGRDGVRLIDETDGQIIVLSWFLPDEAQKNLPEIFRRYPKFHEALKFCGADSFFTVMLCPELFFSLAELLDGTRYERFTMAYAVLLWQSKSGEEAVSFLKSLGTNDCRKIARYAAEIMNLPDDEDNSGGILAPMNEPLFMQFVLRYGDAAADMCKNFSSLLDVSKLLMMDWHGDFQDVSPVLEAAKNFGLMGLQAAIHFRFADDMQRFILNYPDISRRKDLLMFMLYDDIAGNIYTANIPRRSEGAKWMLKRYTAASDTGEPVAVDDDGGLVSYIPGHDVIAPVYNYIRYGKIPTVGECLSGALDLMSVIPMATAATTVARGIAAGNGRKILTVYAKRAITEPIKSAGESVSKLFRNVTRIKFSDMKKSVAKFFDEFGTRSVVLISECSLPSWDSISDFSMYMAAKAKDLGINVIDMFSKKPELSKLYSKPWMTKRATDYLINESLGIIQEAALKKTLHAIGINSIINHLSVH